MSEILKIVVASIAQQKASHAASAATIVTGAGEKIISPEAVSTFDLIVSGFGTAAVIIAPIFTLYLFYSRWRNDRRDANQDRLDTELKLIMIANEGRRDGDKK